MIQRCHNQKSGGYERYGGRGITVCDRWRESFIAFFGDMGERPGSDYFIDRIDNDGHYCPENCRWATREEQDSNKRTSKKFTFDGRTLTQAQWARVVGMGVKTLSGRLDDGWSIDEALTTPVKKYASRPGPRKAG